MYLGHWIGFLPAQERMALAKLDMDAGLVKYVYRFSHLPEEIEAAQHPDTAQEDIQTGAALVHADIFEADTTCGDHVHMHSVEYAQLRQLSLGCKASLTLLTRPSTIERGVMLRRNRPP